MEDLITAIRQRECLDVVKQHLLGLPRELLEHQEEHYDALHHAIEVSFPEVVHLLFLHGLFLEPHQPRCVPYLHFACWLGRASLIHLLLEHRPNDFKLKISANSFVEFSGFNLQVDPEEGVLPACSYLPVDVAAHAGHVKCLEALLVSQASKCNLKSLVERAVEVGSPASLQLILSDASQPSVCDRNKAFREAVRRKLHKCVELLLRHDVDVRAALNNLNPYHVLYMYSSAYQVHGHQLRNVGLDTTTAALLKHGCQPNSREPFGSYPLYSLLHSIVEEKDQRPSSIPGYHIEALRLLLKGGADPNFDELKYAREKDKQYYYNLAVGRDLFTSGLNAFFVSLQASDTWRPHITEYLEECVELLLLHGANAGYRDCLGETPLHDLMKVLAMQHAMGHVHCNTHRMCHLLLTYGSNPSSQSDGGLFPVQQYFSILCELMGGLIAFERWKAANNAEQVIHMLYYMDHANAQKVCSQVKDCLCKAKDDGMPDDVIAFITQQMSYYVHRPKALQDLCRLCIWQRVGRQKLKLDELHMPKAFVKGVLELFH